jgi:hypothetical protein
MALTMAQLTTETYKLLNEATNSTLGIVSNGNGIVSAGNESDTTVRGFIAEAVSEICRSCVAYQVTGSLSFIQNTRNVLLTSMVIANNTPANATLWFVTDAYIGSTRLVHASESSVRANDLLYASTVVALSSSITNWYRMDNYSVSLYPFCTNVTATTVTVYGYGFPDVTNASGTSLSFIPDDLMKQMIPAWVATKLIMKNIDDPTLGERLFWKNWYNEGRMKLYIQLDAGLKQAGGPFSIPPVISG